MRLQVTSFLLLMLLIGVSNIGVSNTLAQAPPAASVRQAEMALQKAVDQYHSGQLNEAAVLLRGFVISNPDSILIDQAYYYLASIKAEQGDPATAISYLNKVSAQGLSPATRLLQSKLLLQIGDATRVVEQLLPLQTDSWTLPERQARFLSLAEGLALLEEPHRALYFYQQALVTEGSETPREVLSRIYTLMNAHFNEADLAEASFMYQNKPVAYLAMLQLGWRALAADQKERAQEWVSAAMMAPAGFAYREEAMALQSQLADPTQLQRAIGVLLPLTGRYAAFGKRVQRGMELALEVFRPHIPVRLVFRDTTGDETIAAQLVTQLAVSDRVIGIAGPLVGSAAQGAVRRANLERIPLLTLSQKEGLAASSLYTFRNSLTPQLQVRALLDYAMEERGFTQFGIMNPQTRQGQQLAELFRAEVWRRGGEVAADESYRTEQTDFRYQVRLLQGLDPNAPDEEEPPTDPNDPDFVRKEDQPPPPFEALFIPDDADRISLIAPQLAFYGLEGVQLLGSNGWHDNELPKLARQFVEGAVFTDGFFRHSSYPFIKEFVELYFNRYQEEPTILEAQGYDIVGILLSLLNDQQLQSREDLRRALAQMPNYPGVTGATRFDFIGEAEKVLFLLQIQNGTIVQIN